MSGPASVFSLAIHDDGQTSGSVSSVSPAEQSVNSNDIAIIGYGCRVPGGNNSPSQLWDFLLQRGDASGEMPKMRWEPYRTRQPGNDKILSETTSKGYFLDNLEGFDALFFGISPREAEQIDPQQRTAVEVAWEALENAGIPPQSLAGSDTAVFIGVNSDDYSRLLLEDLPNIEAWMGVGTAYCGIPNRISYLLDLAGPSSAVDAACASSLVAIHHGRQALIARETSLVIAGGVNALVGPGLTRVLDKAGAISSDGRCRSFDDSAAGYGRGEGAGVVILKRLSDAIETEDRILAVLKGSAVGADGNTNGIMAPNQQAQEQVARRALKEARLSAHAISYVEAHATSTPIGDPTECAAMANVYGSGSRRLRTDPCYIGSIKSNIGHLEAGAGVMGLIKAVMTVQTGVIPPQANLNKPNTKVNWKESLLVPVTETTAWPSNGLPRRAAVASYGYGGTVSHAVIESAPAVHPAPIRSFLAKSGVTNDPTVLLLSSPQRSRIKSLAANLARWLETTSDEIDLDSVAYTLAVKRGHHKFRSGIVAGSKAEAVELLNALAEGKQRDEIISGRALSSADSKGTVWVFSGHGAQWKDMGKTLLNEESIFLHAVSELDPIIQQHMGFSAIMALRSGDFDTVDKIQILTYVMQIGIAAVLKSAGIKPQAVIGHSLGEIAASVIAGALTPVEGATVCCIRARLYLEVAGQGAMRLVSIPFAEAAHELGSRQDIVAAVDSSPSSCVVSGTVEAIKAFSGRWKAAGHKVQEVNSDVAFHNPSLLKLAEPLREAVGGTLSPKAPKIPLYSTSLSDPRASDMRDIGYWIENMVKPVLLTSAITAAANDGFRVFLEVSSHPIVSHSINECLLDANIPDTVILPTLLRHKSTAKSLLLSMSKLHCIGAKVEFPRLLRGGWLHDVPRTVWEHQPYWRKVTVPAEARSFTHDVNQHVLLGRRTHIYGTDNVLWQTYLDPQVKPFPGLHPLHGTEIVPAAVLLNTFLCAAPGNSLRDVALHVPVVVGLPREVQVLLGHNKMIISSRLTVTNPNSKDNHSWQLNTKTQLAQARKVTLEELVDLSEVRKRLPTRLANSFSVDYLAKVGVSDMGFPWKVLEHFEDDHEMLAKVHADPDSTSSPHWNGTSWASILDAATSISSTVFYKVPLLRMPTAIADITKLTNSLTPKICYIYVKKAVGEFTADIQIQDEDGRGLIDIKGLRFAGIEGDPTHGGSCKGLIHKIEWPPVKLSETPLQLRKVLFIAKASPLLETYQQQLSLFGISSEVASEANDVSGIDKDTVVLYLPDEAQKSEEVFEASAKACKELLAIVKAVAKSASKSKAFCITQNATSSNGPQSLSVSSLIGLARIIKSEEPEIFGGLVDVQDSSFPLQAIKYVQGADVIRIDDTVARSARLRPMTIKGTNSDAHTPSFRVRPHGTYLITGGLGALGIEVATFLAEKGARRIVLVSRRSLPPRRKWSSLDDNQTIRYIQALENKGVSVHTVSVDMSATDASSTLVSALDNLSLPPVLGVIHAAGTLSNETVLETTTAKFDSVIAPKIIGAMALHEVFPPGTLDFMVMFSSCGQLLGFPGQASYASGNAFLDALARHRRAQGDNTISILWTSWRGLGMAASTRYINAELTARGITDVSCDDAFLAWEQIFKADTNHAVVLRTLPVQADEPSPHPILDDILVRKRPTAQQSGGDAVGAATYEPSSGLELVAHLTKEITHCVASTLSLPDDSVDPDMALSELGLDSVMTVGLRVQLQQALKMKVGPTLIWNCPTVTHLVRHFVEEKKAA
ncbi:hypothetical protein DV737_g4178, partial [Chaetothyriales sp. CBS 132003]